MSHSQMVQPEAGQSFKYNSKSYDTREEALKAEVADRIAEVLQGGSSGGSSYWSYVKHDFLMGLDEIVEVVDFYRDNKEEKTQSAAKSPGWDW